MYFNKFWKQRYLPANIIDDFSLLVIQFGLGTKVEFLGRQWWSPLVEGDEGLDQPKW